MRDIKFRGKREDANVWVYGYVFKTHKGNPCFDETTWIFNEDGKFKVDPETVGQYTGMKDKNGVEIYCGDTIKCTDGADEIDMSDSNTGIGCVEWNDIYGFWSISKIENGLGDILQCGYVEIIGNIHEQESHT